MSVRSGIRTEYGEIQSRKNSGREYGPEKTPYLDTFRTVCAKLYYKMSDLFR